MKRELAIFKNKVLFLLLVLLLCIAAASTDTVSAKTDSSDPVSNVFFYAKDSNGDDLLLTVMDFQKELLAEEHGSSGTANYPCLTIDRFPTICYSEGRGYLLDELISKAVDKAEQGGKTANVNKLAYEGDNSLAMMTTDSHTFQESQGNYTYNQLYGVKRYFFPKLYDEFKSEGPNYYANAELTNQIFSSGIEMPAYIATTSYSGRITNLISDGILPENITGGQLQDSLAEKLDQQNALRIMIPMTEAEMRTGTSTTNNQRKWIYAFRLTIAETSPVTASGRVAEPSYHLDMDGNTLKITMDCATAGARIYHSFDGETLTGTAQYLYDGPIEIKDIDTSEAINLYMTAVKEGCSDAGIKSKDITAQVRLLQAKNQLGTQSGVKASSTSYDKIKVTWSSKSAADGYEIYRSTGKDRGYIKIAGPKGSTANSYTDSGVKTGTTYYYKVRACKTVGNDVAYSGFSSAVSTKTSLGKPPLKTSRGKRKAVLKWSKVTGANGYQLYRSTKRTKSYKKIKTITKNSTVKWTNKNLKKGKTYYYKVRAYRKVSGKTVYGSFSSVKGAKIK